MVTSDAVNPSFSAPMLAKDFEKMRERADYVLVGVGM